MLEIGVTEHVARELLVEPGVDEVRRQLDCFGQRKRSTNPAGLLVRAIRQRWEPPASCAERQAAPEPTPLAPVRHLPCGAPRPADPAPDPRATSDDALLNSEWDAMSEAERAPMEAEVEALLLLLAPPLRRSETRARFCRQVLRERKATAAITTSPAPSGPTPPDGDKHAGR